MNFLSFACSNADRLTNLTADLAGTAQDLSVSYSYNSAGQISQQTRSPDAYAWQGHYNIDRLYSVNGLNQILTSGQLNLTYDARGNLASSGSSSFTYTADNQLQSAPNVVAGGTAGLVYDALGRLFKVGGTSATIFQYDGVNLVGEYGAGATLRRYVHGPGSDEPIVWYEGSGTGCLPSPGAGAGGCDRRFLMRDERGSIVAVSDSVGAVLATNTYDEYGIPGTSNMGRFQYTGQLWLPEIGMYYYKARIYSPTLGRFLQTDPIGYADGMKWYAYVGGDPVNFVDPLGLCETQVGNIIYTWHRVGNSGDCSDPNSDQFGAAVRSYWGATGNDILVIGGARSGFSGSGNGAALLGGRSGGGAGSGLGEGAGGASSLPCATANHSGRGLTVSLGFTDTPVRGTSHAFVVLTDRFTGRQFASRAGPWSGPGGGSAPHITAVSGPYNRSFPDFGAITGSLEVGYLDVSFDRASQYLTVFAQTTNRNNLWYGVVIQNSNSYAAALLIGLGFRPPPTGRVTPGYDSNPVDPSLVCN